MHLLIVATLFAIGTLAPLPCAAATQDNVQPSSPNQIQSYETGYSLMTSCNNPQQRAYCVGFIVGVVDTHNSLSGTRRQKPAPLSDEWSAQIAGRRRRGEISRRTSRPVEQRCGERRVRGPIEGVSV